MLKKILISALPPVALLFAEFALPIIFPDAPQWIGYTGISIAVILAALALLIWCWPEKKRKTLFDDKILEAYTRVMSGERTPQQQYDNGHPRAGGDPSPDSHPNG